jgi:hypothetical protein
VPGVLNSEVPYVKSFLSRVAGSKKKSSEELPKDKFWQSDKAAISLAFQPVSREH